MDQDGKNQEQRDREARRARSNANLKPFTKDNQPPGHKKSRKGIPNRSTIEKLRIRELEKRKQREARRLAKMAKDLHGIEFVVD